jgi:hypothetical protein
VRAGDDKKKFHPHRLRKNKSEATRTIILLHLTDMLLDMNIGKIRTPYCSQVDRIALPCSKTMWEADTMATWELEYKKYLSTRKGSRMLKCGDLRQLNDLDVNNLGSNVVEDLSN